MSSSLSSIPASKRRQLAATLGLFAVLFLAVGAVTATGATTVALKAFMVIALVVAVLLALMGWGVAHSVRIERAEQALDDAARAIAAQHDAMCNCGHSHDLDEMHVVDTPGACAHDGSGSECAHSCDTCVLAALRPSPTATRAERLHS